MTKHGMVDSPEYRSWRSMVGRCINVRNPDYERYGGRGITIDPRWLGEHGFEHFFEDMGTRPTGKTLDRFPDNDGPYTKSNCRWATAKEQANRGRNNHLVTFNGSTNSISQWASIVGMKKVTIRRRLVLGWSIEKALTEAVNGDGRFKKK